MKQTIAWLAPVLALGLAACGSSGTTTSSPTTAASAATGGAGGSDLAAYRTCLSQHGVTLPTGGGFGPGGGARPTGMPTDMPTGGSPAGSMPGGMPGGVVPSGVDATAYQRAQQACASLRPTGGFRGGGATFDSSALQAFTSCMKDHGVTATNGPQDLNRSDPKVAAAWKTCSVLLPAATGQPNPAPTTTPTS